MDKRARLRKVFLAPNRGVSIALFIAGTIILIPVVAQLFALLILDISDYNVAVLSDYGVYLSGGETTFRIIPWSFTLLQQITGNALLVVAMMTTIVILTIVAIRYLLRALIKRMGMSADSILVSILSLLLLFQGALYVPFIFPRHYMGTLAPYAWHSPTYTLLVPASVLAFAFFIKIYDRLSSDTSESKSRTALLHLGFSIAFFVGATAKPNFFMCFTPVIVVAILMQVLKRIKRGERALSVLQPVGAFALAVLPSLLYFVYLYFGVYGDDDSGGIGIGGYVLYFSGLSAAAKPFVGLAFPLLAYFADYQRNRKESAWRLGWATLIVAVLIYFVFIETGSRALHGNFGWGLMVSLFILFIIAGASLLRSFAMNRRRTGLEQLLLASATITLIWSIASGMAFFIELSQGVAYHAL